MRRGYVFLWLWLMGCGVSHEPISPEQVKAVFGTFAPGEKIRLKPMDLSHTPIAKKLEHHAEEYAYLNEVEIQKMVYESDGLMVTGFLVKPRQVAGPLPVILYNRGGNRELGRLLAVHAVEILAPLAAEGYVVAAGNYRGNAGSEGLEQFGGEEVRDVLNLILALGQVKEADTGRVGMFGLSRGGMMSYLALKQDTTGSIDCIANLGGITDLEHTIKHHPEIGAVCANLIPGYAQNPSEALKARSAVHWVNRLPRDVPVLLLHGTADKSVDYAQIPVFADSLEHYGIPYRLITFEGENHGCTAHKPEVMAYLKDWFALHLKSGEKASGVERVLVGSDE